MPKDTGIKSYEDWTPPRFLQGEDIDVEQVKLEFYRRERDNAKYRRTNASLQAKIMELEDGGDTEPEADKSEEREERETEAPASSKKKGDGQGPSLNEIRLELALENGLTRNQAMRLHGNSREELEADVKAYMDEHGIKRDADEDEGTDPTSTPPPRRQPRRGDVKSGSERDANDGEPTHWDPAKLMDAV